MLLKRPSERISEMVATKLDGNLVVLLVTMATVEYDRSMVTVSLLN